MQLAAVLFEAFDLANRLEVHLAIRCVQVRELTRQAFAEQITRNFPWLINFGQRQAWQRTPGWRPRDGIFRFDVVPAPQKFTPELFIRPRALHLIENELVIIFDGFDDLSELAHFFFFLVVAALSKRRSCLVRRSETAATDLFETKLNNRSTPGSRWRFATVSMSFCDRRFCSSRCSISVWAVRAR